MDEKENKNTDNTFDVPQDISYPEPHFIIEDVYGGPEPPEFDNEPVMCVYGPPEPGFLSDNDIILDDPHYGSEDKKMILSIPKSLIAFCMLSEKSLRHLRNCLKFL